MAGKRRRAPIRHPVRRSIGEAAWLRDERDRSALTSCRRRDPTLNPTRALLLGEFDGQMCLTERRTRTTALARVTAVAHPSESAASLAA